MEEMKIKIYMKNKGKKIATASVSVDTVEFGRITIKDFSIWRSPIFNDRLQEPINITPPCRRNSFGGYFYYIFIEDKEKWPKLEDEIYSAYRLELEKIKKGGDESVDPNDVPI